MRKFHAYTFESWPRRKRGDLIFTCTEEAFYYAHICNDRLPAYALLEKWRKNSLQELNALKQIQPINYDRIFDLAVRAQLYREAMEEIERLNKEEP